MFLAAIAEKLKTERDFDHFFSDILTPGEYSDLIDRFAICSHLSTGATVQKVCKNLGVASATVVRGNRVLKHGTGKVKKMME